LRARRSAWRSNRRLVAGSARERARLERGLVALVALGVFAVFVNMSM
jgi:hypothetical protein